MKLSQFFTKFSGLPTMVFLIAIVMTTIFWQILPANFQANESTDYIRFYEPVGRQLLAGHGFVLGDGTPATAYPPGYPLILAALFGISHGLNIPEGTLLSLFILICVGTSSVLLFLLSKLVWGRTGGLIAAGLWMTYPFMLWLTKQPNSEIPFVVFFYGGIYLFWYAVSRNVRTWPFYVSAGSLIGCSMLIRPIAIGVILVMVIALWACSRTISFRLRLYLSVVLVFGCGAVVAPWELSLSVGSGTIVPLSMNGSSSIRDGLTFAINTKSYRQPVQVSEDILDLMQTFLDQDGEPKSLGDIRAALIEALRTRPLVVTELFVIKGARSWYGTDSGRLETPTILVQVIYLTLALLGGIAAWKRGGMARRWAIGVGLVVLYFWGMTVLVISILRYMTPVMGLLFALIPGVCCKDVRSSAALHKDTISQDVSTESVVQVTTR